MTYVIYDNFLPVNEFGELANMLGPNGNFPWFLSGRINNNDTKNDDMYFATLMFHAPDRFDVQWKNVQYLEPFLYLTSKMNIWGLHRIKANMYFKSQSGKVEQHAMHQDAVFPHSGALFYLQDCDAPTIMECGTEIESKANRLLFFDPTKPHASSSPTNVPYRVTININYWGHDVHEGYKRNMINPIPKIIQPKPISEKINKLGKLAQRETTIISSD
jgi:hypothetical protein